LFSALLLTSSLQRPQAKPTMKEVTRDTTTRTKQTVDAVAIVVRILTLASFSETFEVPIVLL
jgi:hypothetical protein